MEARVIVRAAQRDGGSRSDIDITDSLRSAAIVSQSERDDWSWGVHAPGYCRLKIADRQGRFLPTGETSSEFNYDEKTNAEVHIEYPDLQGGSNYGAVWSGDITAKDDDNVIETGTSALFARTYDHILADAVTETDAVTDNDAWSGAIIDIFQEVAIRDKVGQLRGISRPYRGDPITGGAIVQDAGAIFRRRHVVFRADDRVVAFYTAPQNVPSISLIRTFLRMFDSTLSVASAGRRRAVEIAPRGGGQPIGRTLSDILTIRGLSSGNEQVINRVILSTGLTQSAAIVQVDAPSSQRKYGIKTTRINLRFLVNREACIEIGRNLLARLAFPRQKISVDIGAWALGPPSELQAGKVVDIDIPPSVPLAAARHGSGMFPEGVPRSDTRHRAYRGRYWIERVNWNIEADSATVELRESSTQLADTLVHTLIGNGRAIFGPSGIIPDASPGDPGDDDISDVPPAGAPDLIETPDIMDGSLGPPVFTGRNYNNLIFRGLDLDTADFANQGIERDNIEDGGVSVAKIPDGAITEAKVFEFVRPKRLIFSIILNFGGEFNPDVRVPSVLTTHVELPQLTHNRLWEIWCEQGGGDLSDAGDLDNFANFGLFLQGTINTREIRSGFPYALLVREPMRYYDRVLMEVTQRDLNGVSATSFRDRLLIRAGFPFGDPALDTPRFTIYDLGPSNDQGTITTGG